MRIDAEKEAEPAEGEEREREPCDGEKEAAASTVVLSIPAYVSGSANNTLAIKVRKATATPFYRPYDTQTTALVGSAAIYVTQQLDE